MPIEDQKYYSHHVYCVDVNVHYFEIYDKFTVYPCDMNRLDYQYC